MLSLSQIGQIAEQVHTFIKNALSGNAPVDAIEAIAALGSAALMKGVDPAADIAAIKAINAFYGDLIAAKKLTDAGAATNTP